MNPQMALDLANQAVMTAAMLAVPILVTSIVVGIVVNVIQTVTSIRDMSLTFVPKLVAAAIVMGFSLPWCIQVMTSYFTDTYMMFAAVSP